MGDPPPPIIPAYILIEPHPKDVGNLPQRIPLDQSTGCDDTDTRSYATNWIDIAKPYAPWRTLADFEYTEGAVKGLLKSDLIDFQLKRIGGDWTEGRSKISLQNYREYRHALTCATTAGVQFHKGTAEAKIWGETRKYSFFYRNPWEWIKTLLQDPSLACHSNWKSRKMFYSEGDHTERFVNEPWTGNRWWEVDDELPQPNPFAHCWLPLHIWLDKGLVTKHVKMFPIVLRALWLPSEIRNASGNGGGVFIGFMVVVTDPGDPDDRTDAQNYEWAQFRREIYQQVLETIFAALYRPACTGETITCADNVTRVFYPGFLIESLDMEEAWNFTCCRAGRANFPCPRCLVRQGMLGCLQKRFPLRTTQTMRRVVQQAQRAATATRKEEMLRGTGLHDVIHFMWNFRFCDPYLSVTYDLLHAGEMGKWGHHLWELTLKILRDLKLSSEATRIMGEFPRWPNLKHINDLATKDFTDGQTHFDILKCIIFVLVQILPPGNSLIPCTRALLQFRMMAGLKVATESRINLIKAFIRSYEVCCERVHEEYGKNFNFPKQHALVHAVDDILDKGSLQHATTRMGEGTHQEVAQHYAATNFRDVDGQISTRDEEQEAVARTRLLVDEFNAQLAKQQGQEDDAHTREEAAQFGVRGTGRTIPKSKLPPVDADNQWIFGSPLRHGDSRSYEDLYAAGDPVFRNFDSRLRAFLHQQFPTEYLTYEDKIEIEIFRCVYVTYQSKDDWTLCEDILRCNDNWYNSGPRRDCVLYNSDKPGLAVARLRALVRCRLPSKRVVDLAVAREMKHSNWRPRTSWDGCFVFSEEADLSFLLMDYVIRGALLAPVRPHSSSRSQANLHFFVDVVDGDMFLRCLNAKKHVCY
ncbi:hypothetical protein FB45DRAFT_759393 [Roridomyces roridus]|uniref:Transposase n=1 Tax=Roridomyces roridus TaxID=1738132 RepID=A0AAD7B7H6_9AGAR|nr:hypothetical protein FB45DRAFT_759393 [Roridomyces roridus]